MKQSINQLLHELNCLSVKEVEEYQDKILDKTAEETNEIVLISGVKIA